MIKAIAIFLISIHLVNILGSYGIITSLEKVHQKKIAEQLDEDQFAGSDAMTLKIPFSLPYSTYTENYERVSGKIEYENEVYHLVKQKFYNDTLYIVCVQDRKLGEINAVLKNLAASMSDTPGGKPVSKTVTFHVTDFEPCTTIEVSASLFQLELLQLPAYTFSAKVNSCSPPDQPPKV